MREIRENKNRNRKTIDCKRKQLTVETKNKNKMKTKNNVQKTILRTGAVVISFVLISLTVNAQEFWRRVLENSSFNAIAMVMVDTKGETKLPTETKSLKAMNLQEEFEPAMDMEAWMTDLTTFDVYASLYEVETETALSLEGWMLNADFFQPIPDAEKALQLENWMTDNVVWEM